MLPLKLKLVGQDNTVRVNYISLPLIHSLICILTHLLVRQHCKRQVSACLQGTMD